MNNMQTLEKLMDFDPDTLSILYMMRVIDWVRRHKDVASITMLTETDLIAMEMMQKTISDAYLCEAEQGSKKSEQGSKDAD